MTMTHVYPLNAFPHVLLLLLFQHQLNEQLLELLVAVVDAELLKAVTHKHMWLQNCSNWSKLSHTNTGCCRTAQSCHTQTLRGFRTAQSCHTQTQRVAELLKAVTHKHRGLQDCSKLSHTT